MRGIITTVLLPALCLAAALPVAQQAATIGLPFTPSKDTTNPNPNLNPSLSVPLQPRAPSPSPTGTCPSFTPMVLSNHNQHRSNHSAPPLVWNSTVAAHAYEWASQCTFSHNTSYGEGQNLALGYHFTRDAISAWYNSEMPSYASQYGSSSPSSFENVGHFTQVVWKGTTSVGCASIVCPDIKNMANSGWQNSVYTVCNYFPPGNWLGEFKANVGQPLGKPVQNGVC